MLIIDKFLKFISLFSKKKKKKYYSFLFKILIIEFDKIIYERKVVRVVFYSICMPRCFFFYNFTI